MTINNGGEFANGSSDERIGLYRRCEAEGVGNSVMKPFCGGQLLDDAASPFGRVVTDCQCMQYELDKPAVLTLLPGVQKMNDLKRILGFLTAPAEECDYLILSTFTPANALGKFVYRNHCHFCPIG